jgi:integrase
MTRRERARLLATLGTVREQKKLKDARIAAIVLCALDAGILPSDALGWRVRDVMRCAGARTRWEVKPAIKVRGISTVLPIAVRSMLLVYSAHAIAQGKIVALDDAPFFGGITLRAVRVQWHAVRSRAELGSDMTFHDLRDAAPAKPKRRRRARLRSLGSARRAAPSTQTHSETAQTRGASRAARTATAHAQTQPLPPAES